jgi:arginine repressor
MTPDAKPAPKTDSKKKPVAKRKGPSKDINKSAEIRTMAGQMKAKGEKPRPKTIKDNLAKQGIVVSSPQISMVLKKMGFQTRKRRKSGTVKAASGTRTKSTTTKVKVSELLKAQKLVAEFGSADRAMAAIQALDGFEEE